MSHICEHCEKELASKRGLEIHITQVHPDVREKERQEKLEKMKLKEYICPYCGEYGSDNLNSLRIHVHKSHDKSSKKLRIDLLEDGEHPTCKCGCGGETWFKSLQKGFCDFLHGHWAKIPENQGWAPGALEKAAETRRKQFENGEREPWNKRMSLEDNPDNEGLQKLRRKNLKENCPERVKKISEALTGRELSEAEKEWNKELQKINKEYWSKEENRRKQREWRSKYVQENETNNPSNLEIEFKEILKSLDLDFKHQVIRHGFVWDFEINGKLVEVHGDFYHVNPEKYDEAKYDVQKDVLKNDRMKKATLKKNGEDLYVFWENDIKNNRESVLNRLIQIFCSDKEAKLSSGSKKQLEEV